MAESSSGNRPKPAGPLRLRRVGPPPRGASRELPRVSDLQSDLPPDTRSTIEQFHAALESTDLFTLLGVTPDADRTTLRRAYFTRSKQFHPDRFYRFQLGPYKKMLERIFRWLAAGFKLLKDDGRRELYRQRLARTQQEQTARPPLRAVEHETGQLEFFIDDGDETSSTVQVSAVAATPTSQPPRAADGSGSLEFVIDD